MRLINLLKGFIAPQHCLICNKFLEKEPALHFEYLCNKCFDNIPFAPSSDLIYNNLLLNNNPLYLNRITSLIGLEENKDYLELIHYFKYQGFRKLGYSFGVLLGRLIENSYQAQYDYIVPVPIHSAKKRERGFNQSDFIAKGISSVLGTPASAKLIKRKEYTQTQTLLSKEERKRNVANVFAAFSSGLDLKNKSCLLVDDVLTTGATINYAAKELIRCGAEEVDGATIVKA